MAIGDTWQLLTTSLRPTRATFGVGSMKFIVATGDGVYTTNDLIVWTKRAPGTSYGRALCTNKSLTVNGSGVLYLFSPSVGIQKSADGITWSNTGNTIRAIGSLCSNSNGTLFLAGANAQNGITYSATGQTWTDTNITTGYYNSIYCNKANSLYLAAGYSGIMKSTNGTSWVATSKTDGGFYSISGNNDDSLYWAASDNGIWKSTDGTTWTQSAKTTGNFRATICNAAGDLYLAGDNNGIWKSTDGHNWTSAWTFGTESVHDFSLSQDGNIIIACANGGIYASGTIPPPQNSKISMII